VACLCDWVLRSKAIKHADVPHPLALLRAHRQRPRGRRAAEQRKEIAPSYLFEVLHSVSPDPGPDAAAYLIACDQSWGTGDQGQGPTRTLGRRVANQTDPDTRKGLVADLFDCLIDHDRGVKIVEFWLATENLSHSSAPFAIMASLCCFDIFPKIKRRLRAWSRDRKESSYE
jgi:hypothetical protein